MDYINRVEQEDCPTFHPLLRNAVEALTSEVRDQMSALKKIESDMMSKISEFNRKYDQLANLRKSTMDFLKEETAQALSKESLQDWNVVRELAGDLLSVMKSQQRPAGASNTGDMDRDEFIITWYDTQKAVKDVVETLYSLISKAKETIQDLEPLIKRLKDGTLLSNYVQKMGGRHKLCTANNSKLKSVIQEGSRSLRLAMQSLISAITSAEIGVFPKYYDSYVIHNMDVDSFKDFIKVSNTLFRRQ